MNTHFKFKNVLAFPTLLLLAACGTELNAPDAEEQQIDLDVAQYAANATSDDIVFLTEETDRTMQPGLHNRAGCRRVGLFLVRCQPRRFGDLEIAREVTFYDSLGTEQEAFDSVETASIHIVASFSGERARENMTMTVNRNSDITISGLYGAETERTTNGTATSEVSRVRHSDENGDRSYDMSASTTITNVVLAVPRSGSWPLSGTISRDIAVEVVNGIGDTITRSRTVVIEFNGTQFVPMWINGNEFLLDLETREIVEDDS